MADNQKPTARFHEWSVVYVVQCNVHVGVGVQCSYFDRVTLHGNAVHDNKDVGVLVDQTSSVTIEHNSITSNCGNGIEASEKSHVTMILQQVKRKFLYCSS